MRGSSRPTYHLLLESRQFSDRKGDPASSRVVQMSEEAAGLDILLAESQKIHVITAEFQRPPTSRETFGVNCGELCLYLYPRYLSTGADKVVCTWLLHVYNSGVTGSQSTYVVYIACVPRPRWTVELLRLSWLSKHSAAHSVSDPIEQR
jgi:hypothetical protein